ncbi:helix-turn-helix transcriptional regulator [Paraburkholderia sediminicola]|uniref:Helix-turn-helix transcriptional regulator n=1 Tax=Paraburkholderia rhynchosiae TaxID=487049 RepID=A0ACC7NJB6_9BURK
MLAVIPARALFAQNVENHRTRLGVSQVELARAAGLGRNTVPNIETKAVNVRLDTVNRLAIALDIDPCLLLAPSSSRSAVGYSERSLDELVAQNLKKLRSRLGLAQEETAAAAGLVRNYVYKIESKKITVTLDTLDALAQALQVESWQMLV